MTKTQAEAAAFEALQVQLTGLKHQVAQSSARVRLLRVLAALLIVLFLVLLIYWYFYNLMQFASVRSVDVSFVAAKPGSAEVVFVPASDGKVEFVRESTSSTVTLTEYATAGAERKFTWSGDASGPYTIRVKYRLGLIYGNQEWPSNATAGRKGEPGK
jgi:hypothetical protein